MGGLQPELVLCASGSPPAQGPNMDELVNAAKTEVNHGPFSTLTILCYGRSLAGLGGGGGRVFTCRATCYELSVAVPRDDAAELIIYILLNKKHMVPF